MTHRSILELQLRDDPMGSARDLVAFVRRGEKAMREQCYETVSLIYLFAQSIQADEKQLQLFLADEFWNDPVNARHRPQGKNILRLSMRFHHEASRKGALYDRCRDYAQALKPFFDAGVEYDQLKSELKTHGGFEGLLEKLKASKAPQSGPPRGNVGASQPLNDDSRPNDDNDEDDTESETESDEDQDQDGDDGKTPPDSISKKPSSKDSASGNQEKSNSDRPTFKMRSHLLIEADSQIQQMAFMHLPTSKFLVEVEVIDSRGEFIRLVATGVRSVN